MKKITLDRLPRVCPIQSWQDIWDSLSALEQKEKLLNLHDRILNESHQLLQLILEIEEND